MKALKITAIVLVALIALLVAIYAYMGGLRTVEITESEIGPLTVIVTLHRGPYSGLGEAWGRFYSQVQKAGLNECDALAFYPDPPSTPEDQLRSVLACRIDGVDGELRKRLENTFPTFSHPKAKTLHAAFPFVNELSYMLGPMKVYPAMQAEFEARGFVPAIGIEVYGVPERATEIGFHLPLDTQRELYEPLLKRLASEL